MNARKSAKLAWTVPVCGGPGSAVHRFVLRTRAAPHPGHKCFPLAAIAEPCRFGVIKAKHVAYRNCRVSRGSSLSTDAGDSEMIGTIASVRRCWIPIMGVDNVLFLQRLLLHYGIYRRYPLRPWPAFKNAWRIAFR